MFWYFHYFRIIGYLFSNNLLWILKYLFCKGINILLSCIININICLCFCSYSYFLNIFTSVLTIYIFSYIYSCISKPITIRIIIYIRHRRILAFTGLDMLYTSATHACLCPYHISLAGRLRLYSDKKRT